MITFLAPNGRPYLAYGAAAVPLHSDFGHALIHDDLASQSGADPAPRHLTAALRRAEALATRAPVASVALRVAAPAPGHIHLNLSNSRDQAVEITASGFASTLGSSTTRFESNPAASSLPAPDENPDPDSLEHLRAALNIPAGDNWIRVLAWLLSALHPDGPYPVLILRGPSGAGKSFAARILRALIDPSSAPLHQPSTARQLLVLALTNWVLALDNVQSLTPRLASAVAGLSTGISVPFRDARARETRQHWTKRPIVITAPDTWTPPPDLAPHTLTVTLPDLPARRPESALIDELQPRFPHFLGALCAALSRTLANPPDPETAYPTRFPHTLALVQSAFPGLPALDALNAPPPPDRFTASVLEFIRTHPGWTGTAADLLRELPAAAPNPRALAARLRDSALPISFQRKHEGRRIIAFQTLAANSDFASPAPQTTPPVAPASPGAASRGRRPRPASIPPPPATLPPYPPL